MAKLLRMPEIAANTLDAVLAEWLVPENTLFAANDAVASVETDKAVVDVPAEEAGVILTRLVEVGARVEVGAPIAVMGGVGEQVTDAAGLLASLGVASGPPKSSLSGGTDNSGPESRPLPDSPPPTRANGPFVPPLAGPPMSNLPGGTDSSVPRTSVVHNTIGHTSSEWDSRAPGGPPISTLPAATDTVAEVGSPQPVPERIFASPLARRLAKEAGLPVDELVGTGPGGRVVRRDVEAAVAARTAPAARPAVAQETGYAEIPHTRMRRAIAARLTESAQTAPHFYLRATVRVGKLLKLRARLNKQSTTRISVNDLIVKAAARAHTLVPEMNVIWTSDAVRQYKKVDIGVAVATERGLFTPVLTDVANRSITNVAEAGKELVRRAKAGQLKQDDLTGGTLSITNLGMFGVEEFAAIINPPQAAILAVGAIRRPPAAGKNKLVRVTLSVDHRPVDGVAAARWLAAFVETVEKPLRILA